MVVFHTQDKICWARNLPKRQLTNDKTIFKNFCKNKKKRAKKSSIKCGSIIFNKDLTKIILVTNNYSDCEKWGCPKGHREGEETYASCAKRETLEETGLLLNINDRHPKIRIDNTYYFPIIYENYNTKLIPKDTNEIKEAKWIEVKDITNLLLNFETKRIFNNKMTEIKQILNLKNKFRK